MSKTEQPRTTHTPALTGLRGVAALMIVLTHVASVSGTKEGVVGGIFARMDSGVAIFFALSGYLLSRPWVLAAQHNGQDPNLKRYARHRALRILPVYWVVLTIVFLTTASGSSTAKMVKNYFLLQIYGIDWPRGFVQSWSLATEASFYVALPFLAILVIRRSRRVTLVLLGGLVLVTPIWAWLTASVWYHPLTGITLWLPAKIGWFAAGMALAVLAPKFKLSGPIGQSDRARILFHPYVWLVSAAVVYLLAVQFGGPYVMALSTPWEASAKAGLYVLVSFLLLGFVLLPKTPATLVGRSLSHPLALWIGKVSFSLFLVHMAIIHWVRVGLDLPLHQGGFWITLLFTLVLSFAASAALYYALEEPIMRGARRYDRRERRRKAPIALASASVTSTDAADEVGTDR